MNFAKPTERSTVRDRKLIGSMQGIMDMTRTVQLRKQYKGDGDLCAPNKFNKVSLNLCLRNGRNPVSRSSIQILMLRLSPEPKSDKDKKLDRTLVKMEHL